MSEYRPEHAEDWAMRLGPADIADAGRRIVGQVVRTPVLRCPRLDDLASGPAELFLKAENLQKIGAFKARGAMHAVGRLISDARALGAEARARGVITFSSGNHAQAVALAAKHFGVPAIIAMPIDAPAVKVAVVRELGAEVVPAGTTSEDRRKVAYELASERGYAIIQPFDHPDIVCGQGTATAELLEDAAALGVELDAIFVPVGGGGVIAGACLASRGRATQIHSVEPIGCDALAASLEAGERVAVEPGPTLADGLKPVRVGALNFAIAKRDVVGWHRVDDDELGRALVSVLLRAKVLVEPSGAAGVAAALREAASLRERLGVVDRPLRVGVIMTGGNVDPSLVAELVQRWSGQA